MSINEFIAFWNEKNVSSAEKRLASAFVTATEQLQQIRNELFGYLYVFSSLTSPLAFGGSLVHSVPMLPVLS